jgi:hypothetical protein
LGANAREGESVELALWWRSITTDMEIVFTVGNERQADLWMSIVFLLELSAIGQRYHMHARGWALRIENFENRRDMHRQVSKI